MMMHKALYTRDDIERLYILRKEEGKKLASMHRYEDSKTGGGPRGVMVKAMDCGIVVSEFELQSRYYVHFRANTLEKGMNPLFLPAMG